MQILEKLIDTIKLFENTHELNVEGKWYMVNVVYIYIGKYFWTSAFLGVHLDN